MQKIFYQWAGVGILALIGWGVDSMPHNLNWTPSIIIWSIAFVWLIGTLVYWLINKVQKGKNKKVKDERTTENPLRFLKVHSLLSIKEQTLLLDVTFQAFVTSPHVMAFCTIDNYLHVDIPITT
jgi:uncharacterized membrane protein SpoIIM required for sporulation